MNSVEILVHEHDNILRMLRVVHSALLAALRGAPVEVDDFEKMVAFIRLYADKTHHGKEEEFLFKAMTDELGAVAENLVRHGMLVEHDIARLYISDLDAALKQYRKTPDDETRLAILVAAGSYEQLLRRHIEKENEVVFPYGEKNLPAKQAEWVDARVRAFEKDAGNAAMRQEQLLILEKLEARYCN